MGAPKKADWREERRKRAWKLKEEGWQQKDIAVALRVSEGAVSHWVKRGREGGEEALKAHPLKGVSPRLTAEQKVQIPALLAKGAEGYGFRGDVWTASRVAEVIKRTFGVRYHRDHVGRLMREAGWSRQKPVERASQRNEEAIKKWSEECWPEIKKSRGGQSHHRLGRRSGLLSVTDGGAYLGSTRAAPLLRVKLTQDHLSAISGITLDGRLFMQVRPTSYDADAAVGFLRVLLRKISGKIVLIWDGSPIHRANALKDFLKRGAAKRLHLEQLPGYAPISIPMRASGITSSGWSWAMSVVPISISCAASSFKPKNACATKRRSSKAAPVNVAT